MGELAGLDPQTVDDLQHVQIPLSIPFREDLRRQTDRFEDLLCFLTVVVSESLHEVRFGLVDVLKGFLAESVRVTQANCHCDRSRGQPDQDYEVFSSVKTDDPSSYEIACARSVPFKLLSWGL